MESRVFKIVVRFSWVQQMNTDVLRYTTMWLVLGELPTLLFTLVDICRPSWGREFRSRDYPTASELVGACRIYVRDTILVLLVTSLSMEALIAADFIPYSLHEISLTEFVLQYLVCSMSTEALFYWSHYIVHKNRSLYRALHANHHSYVGNSFALVNHVLDVPEILIFGLCPAIPCIIFGVNIRVMWFVSVYTNWQGTYGHSGYSSRFLDWLFLTRSIDHDNHHKYPHKNFSGGGYFSLMDRLFGTYKA